MPASRRLVSAVVVLTLASLCGSAYSQATPVVPPPAAVQPVPATMHAIRVAKFGGPEVLSYEQVPTPQAAEGQVLVKVHAAGVNPVDWKVRDGKFQAFGPQPPLTPGYEVSGEVAAIGGGVTTWKAGDQVYAYLSVAGGGGYAEYVAVPANILAAKPVTVDHVHAGGVPLAALTAWQALFDVAKLKEGQTVLIHAGAGGVGHFAVQFARIKGARVIATASAANADFLKSLGADEVIDYKSQKFEELVKDVDVVLDPIGGDTQEKSLGVIKKGGYLVSIVQPPSPAKLAEHGISGSAFLVHPDAKQLKEIAGLIDAGKVKPHVSEIFPLADAAKAHEKSQTGRTVGKIVLDVTGEGSTAAAPASPTAKPSPAKPSAPAEPKDHR